MTDPDFTPNEVYGPFEDLAIRAHFYPIDCRLDFSQLNSNVLNLSSSRISRPSDWACCGVYNNDDDGTERKIAKGWNYHQGTEWLWVAAYYLQARLAVGAQMRPEKLQEARREVLAHIGAYRIAIKNSLPELTQADGVHCPHSCETQSWSIGCLLEVCHQLRDLPTSHSVPSRPLSSRGVAGGASSANSEEEESDGEDTVVRAPVRSRRIIIKNSIA